MNDNDQSDKDNDQCEQSMGIVSQDSERELHESDSTMPHLLEIACSLPVENSCTDYELAALKQIISETTSTDEDKVIDSLKNDENESIPINEEIIVIDDSSEFHDLDTPINVKVMSLSELQSLMSQTPFVNSESQVAGKLY